MLAKGNGKAPVDSSGAGVGSGRAAELPKSCRLGPRTEGMSQGTTSLSCASVAPGRVAWQGYLGAL